MNKEQQEHLDTSLKCSKAYFLYSGALNPDEATYFQCTCGFSSSKREDVENHQQQSLNKEQQQEEHLDTETATSVSELTVFDLLLQAHTAVIPNKIPSAQTMNVLLFLMNEAALNTVRQYYGLKELSNSPPETTDTEEPLKDGK